MGRRLIINADDFGLSEGVNKGIVECFRNGVLTSATLMANGDGFDDARSILKTHSIPTGVHLNIVRGLPVAPPEKIPTLVDGKGRFWSLAGLFTGIFLGRISAKDIETEFRAQAAKALDKGIRITHYDSHRHVHNHPFIMSALKKVCVDTGVRRVRLSCGKAPALDFKRRLIDGFARKSRTRLLADGSIAVNDSFTNLFENTKRENYRQRLEAFFSGLAEGTTEIGCHPGYRQGITLEGEASYEREKDLEFLTDPFLKELIARHRIQLVDYTALKI